MSLQALAWVLNDAPAVPPHLVAPLMGLANHADEFGRGSYPSTDTLSWYTRKDERAVRRDLDKLEELGLIKPGDQRMVLHLPPDKRPTVYNLQMSMKRSPRKPPGKPGRPKKTVAVKTQVKRGSENEGVPRTPRFEDENREGLQDKSGGFVRQNGGVRKPPKPSFEPSLNQTPLTPQQRQPADSDPVMAQGGNGSQDLETPHPAHDPIRAIVDDLKSAGCKWAYLDQRVRKAVAKIGDLHPLEVTRHALLGLASGRYDHLVAGGTVSSPLLVCEEWGPWWADAHTAAGLTAASRPVIEAKAPGLMPASIAECKRCDSNGWELDPAYPTWPLRQLDPPRRCSHAVMAGAL